VGGEEEEEERVWMDDERRMEREEGELVLGEDLNEEWEEEEDSVWIGFREDYYKSESSRPLSNRRRRRGRTRGELTDFLSSAFPVSFLGWV